MSNYDAEQKRSQSPQVLGILFLFKLVFWSLLTGLPPKTSKFLFVSCWTSSVFVLHQISLELRSLHSTGEYACYKLKSYVFQASWKIEKQLIYQRRTATLKSSHLEDVNVSWLCQETTQHEVAVLLTALLIGDAQWFVGYSWGQVIKIVSRSWGIAGSTGRQEKDERVWIFASFSSKSTAIPHEKRMRNSNRFAEKIHEGSILQINPKDFCLQEGLNQFHPQATIAILKLRPHDLMKLICFPISQFTLGQRAIRAGRVEPSMANRLCSAFFDYEIDRTGSWCLQ
ncbi:hypothetical protein M9H77_30715 [Catharanthus roseus]|uniref:Uncharacterized protein n=1 Tax=Catharanthus roseus TaxID=4058 RepID=A0ACC0A2B1_CATRO|nr:hypothetical protein M9H77_30715 [Catharanthus roseus]